MCGRFTLRMPADVLAEQFAVRDVPSLIPRFNIAPSQPIAIVRLAHDGVGTWRELVHVHWGLIPRWAKDPTIGTRMINARSETVSSKPAFKRAFQQRRCLLLADGFYEWQHVGKRKQPYFIHLPNDRPFAFAGLWESWEGPDQSRIESGTILTCPPNDTIAPIHDRMPVILDPEAYQAWLNPATDTATLSRWMVPYESGEMQARAVGSLVNDPGHDNPRCIEPEKDLLS